MKNRVGPLILTVALAMTCSCVILQSQHQNVTEKVQEPNVMGYFLPKGLIHVQFKPKEDGDYDLNITTEYVPDPNFFYALKYQPSAISNDTINKVTVSQKGLLEHVQVSAEDKAADIINKLVLIAKAPLVPSIPVPGTSIARTEGGRQKSIDVVIDPTPPPPPPSPPPASLPRPLRPNSIEEANEKLKDYEIRLTLNNWEGQRTVIPSASPLDPSRGVYYRPLLPWTLRVESTKKDFIKDATIYLPNGAPILSLDITRAAFVTKTTHYTFHEGILTQLEIGKPSEVLGFVDIPLNVVRAIVALPTELIQVKIDTSKMNKDLLAQQLTEIQARDALIDYLKQRGGQPGGK